MNDEYTPEDFKNVRFAKHPDGRVAVRIVDNANEPWTLGEALWASGADMARAGWQPVREHAPVTLDTLREALDGQIRASSRAQSFWFRVRVTDSTACWTWEGAMSGEGERYGYYGGMGAHRFSWILANGPIPAGLFVRHKCDNPPCVNPAHLELGTHQQNMEDMIERQRGWHQKRTECKSGHPVTPETTLVLSSGNAGALPARRRTSGVAENAISKL